MEAVSLGIFIVPTIVLVLVVLLYFHFAKRVREKKNYRNYLIGVATVAFLLNFIWELGQGPLYKGFEYDWQHISFCALASIADMLMVLILLFGIGLIFKNVFWTKQMGTNKVLLIALVGFLGAVLAEFWHLARGDWAYANAMPLMPFVDVGVSPILQFTVLPWLTFLITKKLVKENK